MKGIFENSLAVFSSSNDSKEKFFNHFFTKISDLLCPIIVRIIAVKNDRILFTKRKGKFRGTIYDLIEDIIQHYGYRNFRSSSKVVG